MTPTHEFPFIDSGLTYAALVYEIDDALGTRDVAVFETKPRGSFRYVGCGVFGKRFVRVGAFSNSLAKTVNVVLLTRMPAGRSS